MLFCKNEDRIVEYEWIGISRFLNGMKLSKDYIPMLEDHIFTIDTKKHRSQKTIERNLESLISKIYNLQHVNKKDKQTTFVKLVVIYVCSEDCCHYK